ncbi:hypothetical protein OEZ86_004409 [Tetradesmus obliquus]|nr:hypothetical protein OEZ86_004409 [Tetradesmus obliquus]
MAELQRFVLRSQVISVYRKFIRAARSLPAGNKEDVLSEGLPTEARQHGFPQAAVNAFQMDAVTLKFDQPELEQSFWQHYTPYLRKLDACSAWLFLAMCAPGNTTMLLSYIPLFNIPRTVNLMACERMGHGLALLAMLQLVLMHWWPMVYLAHRTSILLLLRGCILHVAAFRGYGQCPAVGRWFADEPESQFSAFAFRGGVVSLLWHSLGSPLPVQLAAPVQLARLLLYMLQLAPAVCSNIRDVRDGSATAEWEMGSSRGCAWSCWEDPTAAAAAAAATAAAAAAV